MIEIEAREILKNKLEDINKMSFLELLELALKVNRNKIKTCNVILYYDIKRLGGAVLLKKGVKQNEIL